MGNCPTVSHTCSHYLSSGWVHLFVPSVTKENEEAGWIQGFIFFVSGVNQGNEEVEWVQDPYVKSQGWKASPQIFIERGGVS